MRTLLGKWGGAIRGPFLHAAMPLLLFSPAFCHAQNDCPIPNITSISPSTWMAGAATNITINGTGFSPSFEIGTQTYCVGSYIDISVNDLANSGAVQISNLNVISSTQLTATVTPDASDPPESTCVAVETGILFAVVPARPISLARSPATPAPGTAGSPCTSPNDPMGITYQGITVQIVNCTTPTITSITPDGWWATGQPQNVTINGGCFLTSSDAGGPSKVTLTDGAGAVTLSNVTVVSSTQITATVKVTKKAPAETVTLTVTDPPSSGAAQSVTANPAPVVLPVPVIKWRSKDISGDGAKNQSVIVGQPVELTTTPATLPGGFTISNSTWTIPGMNVHQFSHPNSGIVLAPTQTDQPNTTYYWLYPQDAMNVVYTYCATDPNQNQICESPEAKAVFKASSPGGLTLATDDSQLALVQELETCDPAGELPYLEYGGLYGPAPGCGADKGPLGIHLTASGASSGSYVFVQIVDADISESTHATGPSPTNCGVHAGLDGGYPYDDVEKDHPEIAFDGPQMPLPPNALTGTRTFHASMYLLWQPPKLSGAGADSIPVPIGRRDWQFVATAVRNAKGKWERHGILTASGDEGEGFVPSTPDDNAIYGYPQWTHLSSTVCGVSQEVK